MKQIPKIAKTAQELKQHFLESAHPIIDEYVGAALGTAELSSNNAGAREEVWGLVKSLIMQSSDKLNINISSPEDVLKAVSDGRCTIKEGDDLLKMYKQIKEIDTMGQLPNMAGGGGLIINIQASDGKVEVPVGPAIIEGDIKDAN